MPDVYSCPIIENERLTDTAFAITLEAPVIASEAIAGQFVHIDCGKTLRRPICICAARDDNIKIVFEPRGDGTLWLSKRAPGDTLNVLGPLGRGFAVSGGSMIVVGGGIGAPPMLYAAASAKGRVAAVLGFRDKSKILLTDDFNNVCDEVIVTTDDGSFGVPGPVTGPLEALLKNGGCDGVLACGPRAMLRAVSGLCAIYGAPCQVSLEERMGCGVGACLVCACKTAGAGGEAMSRVCKDGPVFNAGEVIW